MTSLTSRPAATGSVRTKCNATLGCSLREMEVVRRPASGADTGFARLAHHEAYREVVVRQFGAWDETVQDRFFSTGWQAARHEIIECDGTPVGYCSIAEPQLSPAKYS